MRIRFRFLTALLGFFSLTGFAQTSYRVQAGQSLPAALTAAAAGDFIYVDGGIYGDISITKKVILIGTGYFGAGGSAAPAEATVGTVTFRTGSEGSVMMGFTTGNVSIGASTISVIRNHTGAISIGLLDNITTANNVVVRQNYAEGNIGAYTATDGPNTSNNFSIKNNISLGGLDIYGRVSGEVLYNTVAYNFAQVTYASNNGYVYTCKLQSGVRFRNNIMAGVNALPCPFYDASLLPPVFTGNVLVPTVSIPGNTTLTTTQRDNMFVGWPTATGTAIGQDARSQLKTGAVALTAGEGGTQAGAFGGDDPYVLGGVPFIPTITQLTVPSTVTQGGTLNVTVKAQTNN